MSLGSSTLRGQLRRKASIWPHRTCRYVLSSCNCVASSAPRPGFTSSRGATSPRTNSTATSTLQLSSTALQVNTPRTGTAQGADVSTSTAEYEQTGASEFGEQQVRVSDLPNDMIQEFEKRLEADVQTIAATVTAVTGVIFFWRGVWSLLDHFIGDSVAGDIGCCVVGLSIIFWIRLSGARIGSFWPGA